MQQRDLSCPECGGISCEESTWTTLMGTIPVREKDGKVHYHDPNWQSTTFSCKNGHTWHMRWMPPCEHGDYGDLDLVTFKTKYHQFRENQIFPHDFDWKNAVWREEIGVCVVNPKGISYIPKSEDA